MQALQICRRTNLGILVVLLALLAGEAAAQEGHDIKNLRLGMTESEVRDILPKATCIDTKKPGSPERFCMDKDNTLAAHPAIVSVSLRSGSAVSISARFSNRHGADMRRAALAKFGKPAGSQKSEVRARDTGVPVERTVLLWPLADQMLILSTAEDPAGEGWLLLSSKAEREHREKTREIKDKDM